MSLVEWKQESNLVSRERRHYKASVCATRQIAASYTYDSFGKLTNSTRRAAREVIYRCLQNIATVRNCSAAVPAAIFKAGKMPALRRLVTV